MAVYRFCRNKGNIRQYSIKFIENGKWGVFTATVRIEGALPSQPIAVFDCINWWERLTKSITLTNLQPPSFSFRNTIEAKWFLHKRHKDAAQGGKHLRMKLYSFRFHTSRNVSGETLKSAPKSIGQMCHECMLWSTGQEYTLALSCKHRKTANASKIGQRGPCDGELISGQAMQNVQHFLSIPSSGNNLRYL